jgi:hypothetical protein
MNSQGLSSLVIDSQNWSSDAFFCLFLFQIAFQPDDRELSLSVGS